MAAIAAPSKSPKKKILLVDDTETVLMFEKLMLAGLDFEIHIARNGLEALARVADRRPDLILLDIVMPGLDGIETCRRLKADPVTREIPVIMVTTKGEPERVEQAFVAGCDDYLTKPLDRLQLLAKVRSFVV